METFALTLFVEVAKLGSFAAVARKHEIDPSTISRLIASLENELQLRLFQRSTRQLSLTEAGEHYLRNIEPLLSELAVAAEAAKALSHAPSGRLRLTASVAFGQVCLLPHLQAFRELYPDIQLELVLTDAVVDLLTANIDLACRLTPKFDSDLVGVKLFDTRYHVCASPTYLEQTESIQQPSDLSQHPCLVFTLPYYRSRWLFKKPQQHITEVKISADISISSALALRTCAERGMGPTLLADWLVAPNLADGSLVNLFPEYQVTATDFDTAVWLLYPSRQYLPNKVRVMVEFLKARLHGGGNQTA